MATIEATVERRIFAAEDGGFAVLALDVAGARETAIGPLGHLRPGDAVRLSGDWTNDPRRGRRFSARDSEVARPSGQLGIQRFLESVEGVGPATARAILAAFGDQTLEIAEREPWRLAEVIPAGRASAVGAAVAGRLAEAHAMARLREWAVPERFVPRILKRYGGGAVALIQENPYRLIDDFEGVGFATADAIARASGVPHASAARIRAGVMHVLAEAAGDGHCFMPRDRLVWETAKLLELKAATIMPELAQLETLNRVVFDADSCYLKWWYDCECDVARRLLAMAAIREPRMLEAPELELESDFEIDAALCRLAGFDLTDEQASAVRLMCEAPVCIVTGGPGVGKGLALDTPIPAARGGFIAMGDLCVGDRIFTEDGYATIVTHAGHIRHLPCYEVCFDDGSTITADEEHLWLTWTHAARKSAGRAAKRNPWRLGTRGSDQSYKRVMPCTATTEEMAATLHRTDGGLNHAIPVLAQPVWYSQPVALPIHPYLLGVWLGNGHTSGATVTDGDEWIRREVERCGHRTSDRKAPEGISAYGIFDTDGGSLLPKMRALNLLGNKHIPEVYKRASVNQRLALMQGLMDTDGTCGLRGRSEFAVTVERLADDFYELACGLGIKAFRDQRPALLRGKRCGTSYRVSFTTARRVFKYPRKADRLPRDVRGTQRFRYVTAVRPVPSVPTRCIRVENSSQLFLAGRAYIPTHNSSIVRLVVELARQGDTVVRLCAPTGRAAKRLSELSGAEAKTIHRLLMYHPEQGWRHNKLNPLPADLVVCDEASMVDVGLMSRLLAALRPGCRLALVGDADQLPSVGPGRVLRDAIESGAVPVARLDRVFRQGEASRLALNAHRLNRGEAMEVPAASEPSDFYACYVEDPAALAAAVVRMAADAIPRRLGVDFLRDVWVLSPMHKGPLGVEALNAALQAAVNPGGQPFGSPKRGLRIGDRVMQQRNDYDLDVYNGDAGTVEAVGRDADDKPTVTVRIDDRAVEYTAEKAGALKLAYACTVHKAQGSEYPVVLLVCHDSHYIMLQRTLLYTGMTRARQMLVLCGTLRAVEIAASRVESRQRWTGLAGRLREGT